MYFPYLRGKQYELIALRDNSSLLAKNRAKVSPIIEPVKDSTTLIKTLSELRDSNINFSVIINPKVGDLQGETKTILDKLSSELGEYKNFQLGLILTGNENIDALSILLKKYKSLSGGLALIHESIDKDIKRTVSDLDSIIPIKYNIIYFGKTNRRYYRNFNVKTVVELDDYFSSQIRNADFKPIEESDFSEEHLFYKDEGFVGFSDFLTIGDNYTDGGFLPYAIAIHLSYSTTDKIKIRHFVSDSNDDASDIAGKFAEALNKLIIWCRKSGTRTEAINEFMALHKTGHFPGLGSIKKLSILNHLELVLSLI